MASCSGNSDGRALSGKGPVVTLPLRRSVPASSRLCGALLTPLICLVFCLTADARDLTYEYRESLVRTAFIYNLSKFVTWPDYAFVDGEEPLILTVASSSTDGIAMESIVGRTVRGRSLQVRTISDPRNLGRTHILYIDETFAGQADTLLGAVAGRPILTISNIEGVARRGGIIELIRYARRLGFTVNLQAAEGARLSLSSEILRLAAEVLIEEGGE